MIRTTLKARARDGLNFGGNVEFKMFDVERGIHKIWTAKNKVVTDGIEVFRDLLGGTGHRPSHIGLGTGTTAVDDGDASIETEIYRDIITRRNQLAAALEFQLFLGVNDGNGFTYLEAGLLETGSQFGDPLDAATLVARVVAPTDFTAVAKTISVELTVTWTINLTAS